MKPLISDYYKDQLRQVHKQWGGEWGGAVKGKTSWIVERALQLNSKSILDYGSGYGCFAKEVAELGYDIDVREYEPGYLDTDVMPEPADFVISVDVLEHVEPEYIDNVLEHIHSLMNIGGYFRPCCVPAHGFLPDGRNLHLIVEPPEWWIEKISEYFEVDVNLKTKGHVGMWVSPKR